jgi:hypothetical protein
MNSLFMLGLKIEIFVPDRTPSATIAKPGMMKVRFRPPFESDSVHCATRVVPWRRVNGRQS